MTDANRPPLPTIDDAGFGSLDATRLAARATASGEGPERSVVVQIAPNFTPVPRSLRRHPHLGHRRRPDGAP